MNGLHAPDKQLNHSSSFVDRMLETFDLSLEIFLTGSEDRELFVDKIAGQDLRLILGNYELNTLSDGPDIESVRARGYRFRTVNWEADCGIIMLTENEEIVGAYIGSALAIDLNHQGLGLGAELVFEFAFQFGSLPAWYLDVPAYSPAGLGAHCRAWHLARDPVFKISKGINAGLSQRVYRSPTQIDGSSRRLSRSKEVGEARTGS